MYYQTLETVGYYGQGRRNVTLERFPFSRQSYTGSFDSDSVKILRVSHGKYFVQMHMHVNTLSCLLTKAQLTGALGVVLTRHTMPETNECYVK